MRRGQNTARFITFEGGEGAGKTTQVKRLSKLLDVHGIQHLVTREPGGSQGAEEIRNLLVDGLPSRWDAETETLLHYAARRDHLITTIEPALEKGYWVLSDRYVDSTFAYQGYGHGVPLETLKKLYTFVNNKLEPDVTFILELPVADGLARAGTRTKELGELLDQGNRYEKMEFEFHERLRTGFIEIARSEPHRCVVIDGSQTPDMVFNQIEKIISARYLNGEHED